VTRKIQYVGRNKRRAHRGDGYRFPRPISNDTCRAACSGLRLLGNSEKVAMKHYLQARESDFQIAISTDPFESGAASGAVAVHNPVQHREDVASHQSVFLENIRRLG
jgi:hypothetical protein